SAPCSCPRSCLCSFPTRRSSDLAEREYPVARGPGLLVVGSPCRILQNPLHDPAVARRVIHRDQVAAAFEKMPGLRGNLQGVKVHPGHGSLGLMIMFSLQEVDGNTDSGYVPR